MTETNVRKIDRLISECFFFCDKNDRFHLVKKLTIHPKAIFPSLHYLLFIYGIIFQAGILHFIEF